MAVVHIDHINEKKRLESIRKRTKSMLKFSKEEEDRGLNIHQESIVIDSLVAAAGILPYSNRKIETMEKMIEDCRPLSEIRKELVKMRNTEMRENKELREDYFSKWKEAGTTCVNRSLWPPGKPGLIGAIKNLSESNISLNDQPKLNLAICADDIRRAKREDEHSIIWSLSNTTALGGGFNVTDELDYIDLFFGIGVRAMELTHNFRYFVGDGCMERYESGLTHYGLKIVERMNNIGMLIDVSHAGYQTTIDAVETSNVPVAATHTVCKQVNNHPRGKTDEEIAAIADKNGYIGICQSPSFLGGDKNISAFLDHVDHAVELVGVDHIGIGTNNKFRPFSPKRLSKLGVRSRQYPDESEWWLGYETDQSRQMYDEIIWGTLAWINWPYFTVSLVTRGYSDKEIRGLIGGNFLKLFERVVG